MLRLPERFSRTILSQPSLKAKSRLVSSHRSLQHAKPNDEDLKAARIWLNHLNSKTVPRSICDISYSRSSGPGGQNVNKVNSKATLKVPLVSLLPLVPRVLHGEIRSSRFIANRSQSLVIQSDESRKQSENLEFCFEKLQDILAAAVRRQTTKLDYG